MKKFWNYYVAKALKILLNPAAYNNCQISKKARVCSHCDLTDVDIDDYSYVGHGNSIVRTNIGKYCSIANGCYIGGANHPVERVSTSPVFHEGRNILKTNYAHLKYEDPPMTIIENDVWIGQGVFIKSGVSIHDGAVVGMGSVVTCDIPAYEIWAGNPAHKIRDRFNDDIKIKLLEMKWWDWSEKEIRAYANFFIDPNRLVEIVDSKKYKE